MPYMELKRQVRSIVYTDLVDVELALQHGEYDRAAARLHEAILRLMEVTNIPGQPSSSSEKVVDLVCYRDR